jgi:GNAT superfamily N-acetyltransferase
MSGNRDNTTAEVEVIDLTPGLMEQATLVLVEAFKSEEATAYHLDTQRPSTLRRMGIFYGIFLQLYQDVGRPLLAATRGGEVLGVAMVRDPRIPFPKRRAAALLLPNLLHMPAHLARHPIRSLRILVATRHPEGLTDPYFTVEMLGVRPEQQGKGTGSKLMRTVQAMGKDNPAVSGIYLNTASESNRTFYENLGFDALRSEDLGAVKVYHMFWQNPAFS